MKHGIATKPAGGNVTIQARIDQHSDGTAALIAHRSRHRIRRDTPRRIVEGRTSWVGLDNIARRLTCQYGAAASLTIQTAMGEGTTAEVRLPAQTAVDGGVVVQPVSR